MFLLILFLLIRCFEHLIDTLFYRELESDLSRLLDYFEKHGLPKWTEKGKEKIQNFWLQFKIAIWIQLYTNNGLEIARKWKKNNDTVERINICKTFNNWTFYKYISGMIVHNLKYFSHILFFITYKYTYFYIFF